MNPTRHWRWRKFAFWVAVSICVGLFGAGQIRRSHDLSKVAMLTGKMKTACVGRYLVDLPAQAEVGMSGERIAGFAIDAVEETEDAFRDRIAAREAEIESGHGTSTGEDVGGYVEARDIPIPGAIGRSFIFDRHRGYLMSDGHRIDMESVSIEAHAPMNGMSFSLSTTSAEREELRDADALLGRLRVRGEDDFPSSPGFCVWRGVFVEPLLEHKSELVTLHVGLPGHPDLGMALDSLPGRAGGEGLLDRVATTDAVATADELLRVIRVRSGKRIVNGIVGDEVLEGMRELNFTTGYEFMWEARGVEGDLLQPFLRLNPETGTNPRPGGKPGESSLSGDALLLLWDHILSSIRLRQGVVPSRNVRGTSDRDRWPPCVDRGPAICQPKQSRQVVEPAVSEPAAKPVLKMP